MTCEAQPQPRGSVSQRGWIMRSAEFCELGSICRRAREVRRSPTLCVWAAVRHVRSGRAGAAIEVQGPAKDGGCGGSQPWVGAGHLGIMTSAGDTRRSWGVAQRDGHTAAGLQLEGSDTRYGPCRSHMSPHNQFIESYGPG
jgi:hypothetical protein